MEKVSFSADGLKVLVDAANSYLDQKDSISNIAENELEREQIMANSYSLSKIREAVYQAERVLFKENKTNTASKEQDYSHSESKERFLAP